MNHTTPLEKDIFATIIRYAPLVSIDLIVNNRHSEILLGKRSNAPARDMWFVPGGRIYKGERLNQALERVILEELGSQEPLPVVTLRGVYDHLYEDNAFNDPVYGTHYVVLAHQLKLDLAIHTLPDEQHGQFRWWSIDQLLASPEVHPYTKAYFK